MQTDIRVLIVDDQAIVRKGTMALLAEVEGITVVGEAANGQAAIEQASMLQPDVILMDLVMPYLDGIEATRQITARQPQIRVLALTSFATDDKIFPAIKAGALGYMLKDCEPEELVRAIRQVYRGEPSLDPSIARKVLAELRHPTRHESAIPDPLTQREVEVLRLVAQGLENQTIADTLGVTEVTVRTHVSHILDKLHLANRVQATLYALREGLTSLDEEQTTRDEHG
ncbi:MAG: response regulator transcription factor [Caldilineaceae bacterium]|nr:response regulator transcription factor [Caldilineaceae bacterium]